MALACLTVSLTEEAEAKLLGTYVYFTVGFTLPLVLTNGLEVKLSGALAPLSEQI